MKLEKLKVGDKIRFEHTSIIDDYGAFVGVIKQKKDNTAYVETFSNELVEVTPRQIISVFRKRKKEFLGYMRVSTSKNLKYGYTETGCLYDSPDETKCIDTISIMYKIYGVKVK